MNHRLVKRAVFAIAMLVYGSSHGADGTDGVIAEGLRFQHNAVFIPVGQIEIASPLMSAGLKPDFKSRRFPSSFYEDFLQPLVRLGMIEVLQHKQNHHEQMRRTGAQTFSIAPTEKLKALVEERLQRVARPHLQGEDLLVLPFASVFIERIASNTEYHSPKLSASDKHRLVVGVYRTEAAEFKRSFSPELPHSARYRFKALLKFDPIADTYTFVTADYGPVDENSYVTSTVP